MCVLFLVVECHQHMQLYNMLTHGISVLMHDSTQCAFLRLMVEECVQIGGVFGCGLFGCSGLDVCKFIIILYFVLNCTN